jgi:LPS sulfotransferase NodH
MPLGGRARAAETLRRAATRAIAPVGRSHLAVDRRFVIYCPPRTGSDLLVHLLDTHPRVRCEGEILTPPVRHPFSWFDGRAAATGLRGRSAWGFKLITHHLRWHADQYGDGPEFLERLVDDGFRIICLRRRSWLLQALSLVHATRTKYHFTVDDDVRFEPMTVDPVQLLYFLYDIEEQDETTVATLGDLPRVELWYEDDLLTTDRQQATLDRLTDELGVERIPATSRVVAVAPPTIEDRVANLDEVADLIGRTRFGRFLEHRGGGGRDPATVRRS